MKPVLAVDIDDVLVPHEPLIAEQFKNNLRPDYPYKHLTTLDLKLETEEFRRKTIDLIEGYIASKEFFELNPIKDAAAVLSKLKVDYTLVVVSVRPVAIKMSTESWLGNHFSGIFDDVRFVDIAEWGQGPRLSKAQVLDRIGASILIDDSLRHVSMAAASGRRGILFGQYPWNQTEELPEGVVRASDWAAVLTLLASNEGI